VGWMLREMGKRVSMDLLRDFLRQHAHEMPRTMLRYAIEKMLETERKEWMSIPADRFASDYVVRTSPFAGIPVPEFVDLILNHQEQGDEAMYYLLHQRLEHQLRERYEAYRRNVFDGFEDVIEDFFLYLREGNDGRNSVPYQSLRRIKSKDAFEKWLLTTFRNYLNNRAQAEERASFTSFSYNTPDDSQESPLTESSLTDEEKMSFCSQLIAYAHQVFYPRGRFIFLRSLLTMLNKQKALPDKEMAAALGMNHLAYRVMQHRMKANLARFRQRLLQGENLCLDDAHQQMADHIYNDFTHLYPTLLTYYTQTIGTLKCADAIHQLRQEYYEVTGTMAHEPEPSTSVLTTPTGFWEKLNRALIY